MQGWRVSPHRSSLSFSVKVLASFTGRQASHSAIAAEGRLGSFAKLPYVPPTDELLQSALKRSLRLSRNNKLKNETLKARNLTARQLDALTKELAVPLGKLVKGFPAVSQLHQFEQALLLLTLGPQRYERHLHGVDSLRKSLLEVGKGYAAQAAKAKNKADALAIQETGFANMQSVYAKGESSLINLKEVAKQLRRLPTVEVEAPTVVLVGAPNVGKSSLVRALSSGLPEVCDYPFTTRTVKMGHFFINGVRHQVTDTPVGSFWT
ncbi:hypothetical protein WJX73_004556 [Symbiochloris irregularis]|uniref:OBG-type G domain-containing protein n=1 Tax=Symbiochloris irregularis TaxID=706552 RepID=A0AAW1NWN7_9CHLO